MSTLFAVVVVGFHTILSHKVLCGTALHDGSNALDLSPLEFGLDLSL